MSYAGSPLLPGGGQLSEAALRCTCQEARPAGRRAQGSAEAAAAAARRCCDGVSGSPLAG